MIGLYTNVLVRYLTRDDAVQAALANHVIEETLSPERQGFISAAVLAGNKNGCDHTLTFDRLAAKGAGMRLLEARGR